jgi:hypothetical protein
MSKHIDQWETHLTDAHRCSRMGVRDISALKECKNI